ncbi:hypothetical protein [Roseovarius marisflavi]|uniref:hypothetical protein n=1 Tax=Roseovarius marisflavi TaxID=1054996 RepID=UPI001114F811|nr:hypothetical protein [Roseovarius marisflavi]
MTFETGIGGAGGAKLCSRTLRRTGHLKVAKKSQLSASLFCKPANLSFVTATRAPLRRLKSV